MGFDFETAGWAAPGPEKCVIKLSLVAAVIGVMGWSVAVEFDLCQDEGEHRRILP